MGELSEFVGRWMDQAGHILEINRIDDMKVDVSFDPSINSQPVFRDLLGRKSLSLNMSACLIKTGLQIELGEEGLGPTLELEHRTVNDDKLFLIPTVVMGLYDDYEDDFGVRGCIPYRYMKRSLSNNSHSYAGIRKLKKASNLVKTPFSGH